MSKIKKRVGSNPLSGLSWITNTNEEINNHGVQLSEVRYISPSLLKNNPINNFFSNESSEYFESLKKDIIERGIIVPLIAKEDNILVSGHNRLQIALELGLSSVPIQYILQQLSEQEERSFVFKDNILRRQLSATDKEELIKRLYLDEIQKDNRGGDRKSQKSKIKSSSELLITLPDKIEAETGIKAGTVKRILAKLRKEPKSEPSVTLEMTDKKSKINNEVKLYNNIRRSLLKTSDPLVNLRNLRSYLTELEKELAMKS